MRLVLFAIALFAACKGSRYKDVGEACTENYHCDYMNGVWCFEGKCRRKGKVGEKCLADADCESYRNCIGQVCESDERAQALHDAAAARAAEEKRKADAAKEVQLLTESGVTPSTAIAEKTVLPPGPGVRVRVVTTTSKTNAFAACKETERLVGGGCRSQQGLVANHPSHHGESDTVGGRWSCEVDQHGAEVTAFAMCSKLNVAD